MSLQSNVDVSYFDVVKTKKPLDTSLTDMGIALTGGSELDIVYEEESLLSSLFFNTILPVIFLVLIFTLGMRLL